MRSNEPEGFREFHPNPLKPALERKLVSETPKSMLALAALTAYSAVMFGRLQQAVPDAVLFGDIGKKAYGRPVCFHLAVTEPVHRTL